MSSGPIHNIVTLTPRDDKAGDVSQKELHVDENIDCLCMLY